MNPPASGPTLLGVDVIWVATLLARSPPFAVLLAIYAATTVRDPMARRVKALNERREQLKAGIVASTNKRKKLTNKNEAADKVRGILSSLQDAAGQPAQEAQKKLLQAGIRSKDLPSSSSSPGWSCRSCSGGIAILGVYVLDWLSRKLGRAEALRRGRGHPARPTRRRTSG
jgi:tight adherence protein C